MVTTVNRFITAKLMVLRLMWVIKALQLVMMVVTIVVLIRVLLMLKVVMVWSWSDFITSP